MNQFFRIALLVFVAIVGIYLGIWILELIFEAIGLGIRIAIAAVVVAGFIWLGLQIWNKLKR